MLELLLAFLVVEPFHVLHQNPTRACRLDRLLRPITSSSIICLSKTYAAFMNFIKHNLCLNLRRMIKNSPTKITHGNMDPSVSLQSLSPGTAKLLMIDDLSTFHESDSELQLKVIDVASETDDDPFDPLDLVGLIEPKSCAEGTQSHSQISSSTPLPSQNQATTRSLELNTRHDKERLRSTPSRQTSKQHQVEQMPSPSSATTWQLKLSRSPLKHKVNADAGSCLHKSSVSSGTPIGYVKQPLSIEPNPIKYTSYMSQEQMRHFSTSAPKRLALEVPKISSSTIQLATQKHRSVPPIQVDVDMPEKTEEGRGKVVRPISFSKDQEYVLELAKQGESLFFTGSAGTGKSILLSAIIKLLKQMKGANAVAVTASTGLAACNIGGITLHSFSGIGLGKGNVNTLLKNIKKNTKVKRRWKETEVLIIDEISMIDGALFDKLDHIARNIRGRDQPFGGLQLIVCGDFYQLPPVSKAEYQSDGTGVRTAATFAFESSAWNSALKKNIILKEVFRQKGDQTFIDMLNDMRHGIVTPESEKEFLRLSRPLECPAGIVPTELYATRDEVEKANNSKLDKLESSARLYVAKDGGTLPPTIRNLFLNNFLAPRNLFLKEGAQVMCVKNFDDTLVNGTLGRVLKFVDRDTYMSRTILKEQPNLSLKEFKKSLAKEKIAHEISQNSAQSVSASEISDQQLEARVQEEHLDSVFNFLLESELDNKACPEPSDINEETLTEDQLRDINMKRKLDYIKRIEESSTGEKYPLVRFMAPDGVTTRDALIEPEKWDVVDELTEEVTVFRIQLPLMLAWAMSIHKSQGLTLPKARVDMSRIFESGQAYVALSRAVSRNGIQILNFKKDKVKTHQIVEQFYAGLSTSEDRPHN